MSKFKLTINEALFLALRQVKDAASVFTVIEENRTHLQQWLPWLNHTQSVADSINSIEQSIVHFEQKKSVHLGIWYKEQFVGMIGLNSINHVHRRTNIGYWLAKNFGGKGIITQSCQRIIDYAFNDLDLHRIEIRCAVDNKKSRAVAERLGFKQEGILKESECLYGQFVDQVVYGIVKMS